MKGWRKKRYDRRRIESRRKLHIPQDKHRAENRREACYGKESEADREISVYRGIRAEAREENRADVVGSDAEDFPGEKEIGGRNECT